MIVLLPLRGWVGDAMAIEMSQKMPPTASATLSSNVSHNTTPKMSPNVPAQGTPVTASENHDATKFIANYLYRTWENSQFGNETLVSASAECPGHSAMLPAKAAVSRGTEALPEGASTADEPPPGNCSTCGVCQICHSVALANWLNVSSPVLIAHSLPLPDSTPFASAFAALCQKPPIS